MKLFISAISIEMESQNCCLLMQKINQDLKKSAAEMTAEIKKKVDAENVRQILKRNGNSGRTPRRNPLIPKVNLCFKGSK